MLLFAAYLIVGTVLLVGTDGRERDVVAGIWQAFMHGFVIWCALVALAGAIIAASAASVMRELDPGARAAAALEPHHPRPGRARGSSCSARSR